MTDALRDTDRFGVEAGHRVIVQVPHTHVEELPAAIARADPLKYGACDHVSFTTAPGTQRFRSTGGGRNAASDGVVRVPCTELSVFLPASNATLEAVLRALYATHPYEEPVILVQRCTRARHRPGMDENNPNRFWNRPPEDWLPPEHR